MIKQKSHSDESILGVRLSSATADGVLRLVLKKLAGKHQFFIVTPNPEILVSAYRNRHFASVLNTSDVAIPDGVGLSFLPLQVIKGREMMLQMFDLASKHKLRVFLLGSSQKVIDVSLGKLGTSYPDLKAMGLSGPLLSREALPIGVKQKKVETDTIAQINKFKPDILFIAFGAPKQELWFDLHRAHLNVGGAMVVGGALDYFSGEAALPPRLMAEWGLEWLWRVVQDPKRWPRIMSAVIVFPVLVLKEKIFG